MTHGDKVHVVAPFVEPLTVSRRGWVRRPGPRTTQTPSCPFPEPRRSGCFYDDLGVVGRGFLRGVPP